jgi:putative transposase
MHFEENYTYHIYNRSNEMVFRTDYNYEFFLEKFKKHILPFADILVYCLMPNHLHLMVQVNSEGANY